MRRSARPVAKMWLARLLALAAALVAPSQLAAQADDPFALPKTASIEDARAADLEGPGLSVIVVDGRAIKRMVDLKWIDGTLAIDADAAEMAGLPIPDGVGGFIKLDDLSIADWSFDRLQQRLTVKNLRKGDGPNNIDVAQRDFLTGEESPMLAALIDYDLSASVVDGEGQFASYVAPRISYGNFLLSGGFQYISNREPGAAKLVRLNTTASIGLPRLNLQASVGDVITAGAASQRPLRIGGLQIGTDFALRPDLVTMPMPAFHGSVAVPTTLDVIVNDQRFSRNDIEAGDYQVRNIPVTPGRGEVAVVVQDEAGREVVQSTRVYIASEMLAPGLWEGAANVGWIRRRFGEVSNDYADLVGTFFLRRGVSNVLSLGVSGEAGVGVVNAGVQAEVTISHLAMAFAEVRYSRAEGQTGHLLRSGIESSGEGFSGRLEAIWPSSGYRDVASETGDPLPPRQINGSISFNLRDTMRLQVTASHQKAHFDPRSPDRNRRTDLLRASLNARVSDRIDLHADVGYRKTDRSSVSATIGVSMRFGGHHSAQANLRYQGKQVYGQAGFYRPDLDVDDIGYGVRASVSDRTAVSAMASYRSQFTRLTAEADYANGDIAARAGAQGTLIIAENTVYARNQTGGAYALVRTGTVEGVTVTRENRVAGVTDGSGRLLVENVTPLVPMQFDVDPDLLPVDAVAKATYRRVIVGRGAVARVNMDVEAYRSQLIRLVDGLGRPLAAGTPLTAQPSGREYHVAFDGLVDVNGLSQDDELTLRQPAGGVCHIPLPDLSEASFDSPQITAECAASTIALKD